MSAKPDAVTQAVRAGLESDADTGAVVPPIQLSTTYAFRAFDDKRAYDYSRSGNPTRDLLARALADLEGGVVLSARGPDPERGAIERQNGQLAMRVLNSIAKRDREVLVRFYLQEQTPDEICQAMQLTETQFRLIKSRAKARFGELGKRRLASHSRLRVA